MAVPNYITAPGKSSLAAEPYFTGFVQHEANLTEDETYAYLADEVGSKATEVESVFLAAAQFVKENAQKANITQLTGIASIRNICRGSFETLNGPWVPGRNYLVIGAVELDPFKSALDGIVPKNKTEGARPVITSVLDNITEEYDVITGTDEFTLGGQDLGPDPTKADEYVGAFNAAGELIQKATLVSSTLQSVRAKFTPALQAGEITLAVVTRSGYGEDAGIRKATRKVTIR